MSSFTQADLAKLDESSKQEIMKFIEAENSKTKVQGSIHQFTDLCFKKCVTSIGNGQLSSNEEQCLSSCVNRFLDTNIRVVQGYVCLTFIYYFIRHMKLTFSSPACKTHNNKHSFDYLILCIYLYINGTPFHNAKTPTKSRYTNL